MPNSLPHGRRLRRHRNSAAGYIYLVTFCCRFRTPLFLEIKLGRVVSDEIVLSDTERHTSTYAFVVMPDHVHWLFQLQSQSSLPAAVRSVKGRSALRINRSRKSTGSLWQPGYHERALRSDESLLDAGHYVIANPVRAGLVARIEDYPLYGLMLTAIREANRG
ncbi:MAG: REP-associated tyrosine transposase [Woeseiaceae bacterium]